MTDSVSPKIGLFTPLILWLVYSLGTVAIFEFGPMEYPLDSRWRLYLYLFFVHLAVIFGYYYGFRKVRILMRVKFSADLINKRMIDRLALFTLIGIGLGFYKDYTSGASISSALEDALAADDDNSGGGVLGYVIAIFNITILPFLAIAVISIRKASRFSIFVLILHVLRILYSSFIDSSRHGVFMLLVVGFFAMLALIYSRQIKVKIKKFLVGAIVAAMLFLSYSSYVQVARQLDHIGENYVYYIENSPNFEYNYNSPLIPEFTGSLGLLNPGILTGYFYFGHAYNGLGHALNLPFKGTTLFFGHSDFMIRNLARIVGEDVYQYSYPHRVVSEGLGYRHHWYTTYAWLASDTTFIGSIVVFFFFGSLFARSWIRVLRRPDLISCAVLGWMSYLFFQVNITFVPADLGAFISFWGSLAIFIFRMGKPSKNKSII